MTAKIDFNSTWKTQYHRTRSTIGYNHIYCIKNPQYHRIQSYILYHYGRYLKYLNCR